jgi:hypothetical protein
MILDIAREISRIDRRSDHGYHTALHEEIRPGSTSYRNVLLPQRTVKAVEVETEMLTLDLMDARTNGRRRGDTRPSRRRARQIKMTVRITITTIGTKGDHLREIGIQYWELHV